LSKNKILFLFTHPHIYNSQPVWLSFLCRTKKKKITKECFSCFCPNIESQGSKTRPLWLNMDIVGWTIPFYIVFYLDSWKYI